MHWIIYCVTLALVSGCQTAGPKMSTEHQPDPPKIEKEANILEEISSVTREGIVIPFIPRPDLRKVKNDLLEWCNEKDQALLAWQLQNLEYAIFHAEYGGKDKGKAFAHEATIEAISFRTLGGRRNALC